MRADTAAGMPHSYIRSLLPHYDRNRHGLRRCTCATTCSSVVSCTGTSASHAVATDTSAGRCWPTSAAVTITVAAATAAATAAADAAADATSTCLAAWNERHQSTRRLYQSGLRRHVESVRIRLPKAFSRHDDSEPRRHSVRHLRHGLRYMSTRRRTVPARDQRCRLCCNGVGRINT